VLADSGQKCWRAYGSAADSPAGRFANRRRSTPHFLAVFLKKITKLRGLGSTLSAREGEAKQWQQPL